MREGLPQFSHPISHRTPHYRMGKDGIVLLIAIKKRPIFRRQRDCKIQDDIDGNSLGNGGTPARYHFATQLLSTRQERTAPDKGCRRA